MSYKELKEAMRVLNVPPLSTFREIKKIYRDEVKKNHPDATSTPSKSIEEINRAYGVLKEYVENYRFYFTINEYEDQFPQERHARKFYKP